MISASLLNLHGIMLLSFAFSGWFSSRAVRMNSRAVLHRKWSSSMASPPNSIKIDLTKDESKFFKLLRDFVRDRQLGSTVRVAGGWVRDKVLELPGKNDVDVAIDNMTGVEFVTKFYDWYALNGGVANKLYIVKKNPEKSKHLETVSTKFESLDVDFVNLRTETYTDDSRVPLMAIGTAADDAFRRDLTINTLFYNIHTNQIEDFTKLGLSDLQSRVIRTPLPPLVTLTDDPLRSLRAIRFACRFNFQIDNELLEASLNPAVMECLRVKVSTSRVFAELKGMLLNNEFPRALYLLYKTGVFSTLLPISNMKNKMILSAISQELRRRGLCFYGLGVSSVLLVKAVVRSPLFAADPHLHRIRHICQEIDEIDSKRRMFSFAGLVLAATRDFQHIKHSKSFSKYFRDGFEFSQQDIRNMAQLHYHSEHFYFLLKQGSSGAVALFDEVARPEALAVAGHGRESCVTSSGLTINQLDLGLAVHAAGGDYKESLLLACTRLFIDSLLESFGTDEIPATVADELVDALAATSNVADHECFPLFKGNISDRIPFSPSERQQMLLTRLAAGEAHLAAFKEVLHKAEDLLALVDLWDLERMFRNPPIMNGDELKNINKSGINNGLIIKEMILIRDRWQICNAKGTKDDFADFLRRIYSL